MTRHECFSLLVSGLSMKKFRMAIHIYSCSNLVFILLHKFAIDATDKYGAWSMEAWVMTSIIWLMGVLISWIILLIDKE